MPVSSQFRRSILCLVMACAVAPAVAAPPGFTMERTGARTDFDYFSGGWTTVQRRLQPDGNWNSFPGTLCKTPYLEGGATVDELYFPTLRRSGLTLRLYDPKARQWSIYFVSSTTGRLDPIPVVGGFEGPRGEFYASDTVDGKPVKVRYLWTLADKNHARWEQAFSYDDKTWQTNWIADFTRGDAAKLCEQGQPRR